MAKGRYDVIKPISADLSKKHNHCIKSVPIRSYSGLHFPALRLNTERSEYLSVLA